MGVSLKKLIEIPAYEESYLMYNYLLSELDAIPGVKYEVETVNVQGGDDIYNIFITKGKAKTYPTFAAHYDTVHKYHLDKDKNLVGKIQAIKTEGIWHAIWVGDGKVERHGTGGDDKCGLYAIFKFLEEMPACKAMFAAWEEGGCVGSGASEKAKTFFKDARWIVQIDRQYKDDIVIKSTSVGRICSEAFETDVVAIGKDFGYKACFTGGMTDVIAMAKGQKLGVSVINLSAGYWNPHRDVETISEPDLLNCMNFVREITAQMSNVYPFEWKPEVRPVVSTNIRHLTRPGVSTPATTPKDVDRKKCFICKHSLFPGEVVVCNICVRSKATFNRDVCKSCRGALGESLMDYCTDCRFCTECQKALLYTEEFTAGYCRQCQGFEKFIDTEAGLVQLANFCEKCGKVLTKIDDKISGLHSSCNSQAIYFD